MITIILTLALAAVALAAMIRALAPLSLQLRKPLSCDLCMSAWCGWAAAGAKAYLDGVSSGADVARWALGQALPAIGLCFVALSVLSYLRDVRGLRSAADIDSTNGRDST